MKKYINFLILILFSFGSVAAFADEILIEAQVGEKNSQFRLKPDHGDYVMSYQSNFHLVAKTKIGKKNYQYVVRVANEIITASTAQKKSECNRDSTLVQYTNDSGKVNSTKVCLFSNTEQSAVLLNLINTMTAGM